MRRLEQLAGKSTALARPHVLDDVVAAGLGADAQALGYVFADGPGAFAEAPVGVFLVGPAVHHGFAAGGRPAVDGFVPDFAHAFDGGVADGAVARGGGMGA